MAAFVTLMRVQIQYCRPSPDFARARNERQQSEGNPQGWLTDVLTRIADHPINKIHEPLPWRFQSAN